ncbi:3-oxoacyl-[acyl-carrier protein] reductase [Entomortierella parvispora]|uniref:3-oxoacyl-[acyl-carrier protein] reductase n=1 Tax=Entomortierella parvispora TaxID=205924 RepID=A0A9P3HCM0_9FUNG|nr:3-oxoacyl-[acyl-carrier protein] reductase [Entomortierella parvispora]
MSSSANQRATVILNHLSASATHPSGLLSNQVAIVTGAGQGIGGATALLFAKEGASVVVSDLDDVKGKAIAEQINKAGGKAIAVSGDVTDPAFPDRLISETIKAFGKINIIINNAGYTFDGMLHKTTDKQFQLMLDVHNIAPFRILRAAAPHMRLKDGEPRSIVNVSSTSGLHGNVGQANYAAAKAGVVGFTKTVAKEWGAFGVRCNTVAFGYVDTRLTRAKENGETMIVGGQKIALGIPMGAKKEAPPPAVVFADTPLKRAGQVEEAAGSVLLLCSPFASYITGHTLEVTGGKGI